MMKTRAPSLVAIALLCAAAACKDSSAPHALLGACADTTAVAVDLALAPGGVQVLTGSQLGCVRVPAAGASGAEYVFAVTDVDTKLDVSQGYTFNAHPLSGTAANVASPTLVARAAVADAGAAPAPSFANAQEATIRAYERAHLRGPSLGSAGGQLGSGVRAAVAAAVPTVGQTLTFRVPSTSTAPDIDACKTYDSLTAVVKYVGTSSIIAQDLNAPASGFSDADFQAIATEFDTKIYATDVSYFGNPSDIDVNGKVVLLFTPLINKATPKGSASFFAGFFFAGDLFPRTAPSSQTSCKESNVGELFYLLVPDPTGAFGDARSTNTVRQITRGTVAHEFQHMINAGVRLPDPNAQFEETWLDEALAHLAEEAVGRDERGFGDLQPLGYADVSAVTNDYFAFFDQNLRRFRSWLQRPDTSAGPSKNADVNLSSRGAAWAIVRYTADQYSGGDVRGFTRRLVVGPQTGIANLAARAGTTYEAILTGWDVANYADDLTIPGLDARYTYPSWLMRDAEGGISGGAYPLRVTSISTAGTTAVGNMISGAAAYFRWNAAGTAPALGVRLLNGNANAPATFTGARLVVLRVR